MLYFTIALLSAFMVGLLSASGLRLRGRIRRRLARSVPVVDDRAVSQILETGVLAAEDDEPLDQAEIDEEERRFWSERWDEPEER
ncbi:MAG: hypothetical protein ACYC6F_09635 [Longimicrobiales bacterium]